MRKSIAMNRYAAALGALLMAAAALPAGAQERPLGAEVERERVEQMQRERERLRSEIQEHQQAIRERQREMLEHEREIMRHQADAAREMGRALREQSRNAYFYAVNASRPCGRLGISFADGDQPRIGAVMEGSAAWDAGIRSGDQLLRVDGAAATAERLAELAAGIEPGQRVRLHVRRDGGERTYDVEARSEMCRLSRSYSRQPLVLQCLGTDSSDADAIDRCNAIGMELYARDLGEQVRSLPRVFQFEPGDSGVWMRYRFGPDSGDSLFFDFDSVRVLTERMMVDLDSLHEGLPYIVARADSLKRLLPAPPAAPHPPLAELAEMERAHALMIRNLSLGLRSIAGAQLTELNPGLAEYFQAERGVLVTDVAPESPAERGGLRAGDVITAVGGRGVDGIAELREEVLAEDDDIVLEVVRRGRRLEVRLPSR